MKSSLIFTVLCLPAFIFMDYIGIKFWDRLIVYLLLVIPFGYSFWEGLNNGSK